MPLRTLFGAVTMSAGVAMYVATTLADIARDEKRAQNTPPPATSVVNDAPRLLLAQAPKAPPAGDAAFHAEASQVGAPPHDHDAPSAEAPPAKADDGVVSLMGGPLTAVATTAVSIVMILIGGVFTAARTITAYHSKAWRAQTSELNEDLRRKDRALSEINAQNQLQFEQILQLRQQIANGSACPFLSADGVCHRATLFHRDAAPTPPPPTPVIPTPTPSKVSSGIAGIAHAIFPVKVADDDPVAAVPRVEPVATIVTPPVARIAHTAVPAVQRAADADAARDKEKRRKARRGRRRAEPNPEDAGAH